MARIRRRISRRGLTFIKKWESCVPYVYDDKLAPVRGKYREWKGEKVIGTLTIGYGHTDEAKHPLKIKEGLRITEAEASDILDVDLDECEADVNRLVKVELTQGQFDALVSLTFNMGSDNLRKSSLLRALNAGDYDGARGAFDLYVRSRGERMQGLQNRRDGEQLLWDARYGDVVLPAEPVHHSEDVDAVQPPSMATSKEGNVIAGAGAVDALHTANEVSSSAAAVKQNAEDAGLFDYLGAALQNPKVLIGVAVLIALGLAWYWRYRRRQTEVVYVPRKLRAA